MLKFVHKMIILILGFLPHPQSKCRRKRTERLLLWGYLFAVLFTACKPKPTPTIPAATPTPTQAPSATPEPSPTPIESVTLVRSSQSFLPAFTYQIGLGDLDLDGDLDAVFSNMRNSPSLVLLNDGMGRFAENGQSLTDQAHGVALGDLDRDNDLDLFITCANLGSGDGSNAKPSVVYFNDGRGNFQESNQDLGDIDLSGNDVNLIDVDGDGDLDAHVVYIPDPDRIYLNDGGGYFTDSGIPIPDNITWGDLNGDGAIDLFVKEIDSGYKTMINDGAGFFSDYWRLADSSVKMGDVSLADFDGDGDLDALIANGLRSGDYPTILLLNNGTGGFTDSGQKLNTTNGASLATGDLNGDGYLDVFVSNSQRPNEVWVSYGGGNFLDTGIKLGGYDQNTKVSLGDLDNDGDLDVFIGSLSDGVEIWYNQKY